MKITLIMKIILLVVLIISAIVGGILAYFGYRFWVCNKIPMENVERRALCYCEMIKVQNKEDQEAKDFCYSKIAYNTKEPSICDKKIQSPEVKDTCYYNLASGMIDSSLCEKIQDERVKEQCKERVEQKLGK